VTTNTRSVDDDRVVTEHHGLPRSLAPWLQIVVTAYLSRVLELTKAGAHRVHAGELHDEGLAHGVAVVGFELEVRLDRR
jgi:hypothetical protein